VTLLSAGDVA